jgi:AcrR family transcriptional regulator
MGRQRQPQIKQRLLDACTDHALEHGLPDRLGPLAAAAGTSSRMLIYHFETRDGLLREILGQARQRQVEAFTDLIRLRPDEPYPVTLARAWSAISGPQGEPYLRMFSRLHDTAGEPLWPGFRRTATTDWLAPLEDGMRSLGRPELATVVLAVIRGLLMDLDATGDTTRTHRAFADFLTTIDGAGAANYADPTTSTSSGDRTLIPKRLLGPARPRRSAPPGRRPAPPGFGR